MDTLLIVEDEKLIRQGIKTMVQRSGVPVEVIMECNNGLSALEILKEQKVDAVFTDIRMPKMDGIELVKRITEMPEPPIVVAISGYDDFSYAVEMLRNGVMEYILKPVERNKVKEVLEKINSKIDRQIREEKKEKEFGIKQLRYLLSGMEYTSEDVWAIKEKYADFFFNGEYVVCCCSQVVKGDIRDSVITLKNIDDCIVYIMEECELEGFLGNSLEDSITGISLLHVGIDQLKAAYEEALDARKKAFCYKRNVYYSPDEKPVPKALRLEAEKMLDEQSTMQRIQLIGTSKSQELSRQWEKFFSGGVSLGRISPQAFFNNIFGFLMDMKKIYKNSIDEEQLKKIGELTHFLSYRDIGEYQEELMNLILSVHNKINAIEDEGANQQKIKQAIEYIEKNYDKDLNMAVVSNHFSMNYSLFSYSFKQYTGKNFVSFLKKIRISKAKELLVRSDMKIIEISQAVGYENEKNFMKIFKNECGVSPTEYRKNMKRT